MVVEDMVDLRTDEVRLMRGLLPSGTSPKLGVAIHRG